MFSCYWHLVSLLVVLYLIEKYHNANKHTNRCTIITTNEIFIVTYLPGSSKLDTFKSLYWIEFESLRAISSGKWQNDVRQYYSVLVFIVRVRVSTSPGPQFIIRCLLLKLPSKTFRPSIKVFWKDHYLDCVLTLATRKYYLNILLI